MRNLYRWGSVGVVDGYSTSLMTIVHGESLSVGQVTLGQR